MNKISSLRYLHSLGLNTPRILLELYGKEDLEKWQNYYATHEGRVSLRTEKGDDFKCPHHPNIKLNKATIEVKYLLSQGYKVYVFEAIDPANCLSRGNFIYGSDGISTVEYMLGPGTVRDLERAPDELINRESFRALDGVKDQHIHTVVAKLIPLVKWKDQIVEWSYYNKAVGNRSDYVIFWEIRPWR